VHILMGRRDARNCQTNTNYYYLETGLLFICRKVTGRHGSCASCSCLIWHIFTNNLILFELSLRLVL